MNLTKNIEKIILDYLLNNTKALTIYLFGSILKENFNNESDIDIAVIFDQKIPKEDLFNHSLNLGVLLKRDIDLVDFKESAVTLRIEIIKAGKVIFCENEETRLFYEMISLTEYQKLNEEREIVIKTKYGDKIWMLL
ncbi:MAG: hypothetical protein A2086_15135 [Spirochaetes bacterium GWD1_27_9]|nr:MAG: hypothetical protein A2Z98_00150 [Spirochaetes bacterium GWB1_27_13]OHD31098.1 MAG: hypothetical protein A2086_15135 [Spirochaetes bacterium GWD1_27_9]